MLNKLKKIKMKKKLLLIGSIAIGFTVNAQFTEANSPQIGDQTVLYMVDSLAPDLSGVTGDGVIWDYSGYGGYNNDTRIITIIDPATSSHTASFSSSTHAMEIEQMLTTFYTNSATERISQGFVFSEPTAGDVVVVLDDDPQQLLTYPFDFGSSFVDTYAGSTEIMGIPTDIEGSLTASVDGRGTLILAENTYTNVLRYKLEDSGDITVPIMGDMVLARVQYEYYDLDNERLPIFVHTSVTITQAGATDPMMEMFVVLSKDQPSFTVGIEANEFGKTNIYPNPAADVLHIDLPTTGEVVELVLTDALGRVVYTGKTENEIETIDVSALNKGTYLLRISNTNHTSTKNVIIK